MMLVALRLAEVRRAYQNECVTAESRAPSPWMEQLQHTRQKVLVSSFTIPLL